jgi:hypothetical protein
MSQNLWKIDNELRGILADIAISEGEITPEQEEALAGLQIRREEKLKGYLRAIRLYELEEDKVNHELERLGEVHAHYIKQRAKLESILKSSLEPQEEFKDDVSHLEVSWRRSEALNTDKCDVRKLPEQFIDYKEVYKPKKVELKKYIEAGNEVPGCFIEERWHLKVS